MRISLKLPAVLFLSILLPPLQGWAKEPDPSVKTLPGLEEAQARARLLHASFNGSLQVMHRDFFRKNESRAIPSASLEDVFGAVEKDWGITLRWLASDATAMNVDNIAKDEFQKSAMRKITSGEKEVMLLEKEVLRYAGVIVLGNECLKCHVKERDSLEDRFAALEIRMTIKAGQEERKP